MNESILVVLIFVATMVVVVVAAVIQSKIKQKKTRGTHGVRQSKWLHDVSRRSLRMLRICNLRCLITRWCLEAMQAHSLCRCSMVSRRLVRGHSRMVMNAISGSVSFGTFYTFDYRFVTGSGKSRTEHRYGIVAFRVPLNFLKLDMRSEGFFDKIGNTLGVRDIQFESDEFNREYHIHCPSDKFAFDILNPEMIQYLLSLPKLHWQLMGPYIVLVNQGYWPVATLNHVIPDGRKICATHSRLRPSGYRVPATVDYSF